MLILLIALMFLLRSVVGLSPAGPYQRIPTRLPTTRRAITGGTLSTKYGYDHHPLVRLEPPEYKGVGTYFPLYYNDVYEVNLPKGHRFPMDKYRRVRERVQAHILQENNNDKDVHINNTTTFHVSPLASWEELITTHDARYVERFLTGEMSQQELRNVGFPWSPEGVKRALSSTGGTVAAACAVCHAALQRRQRHDNDDSASYDHQRKHPPLWSAQVAGGTHHAFYDYGEGFCVFSDIAVAANVVLERYPSLVRNILIIDLDVHQGNGNSKLFAQNPHVTTFSMHCHANLFSEKQDSDLDVALPIDCDDATYLTTLRHWLKQISKHNSNSTDSSSIKFDLVFFQAGVDVLQEDRLGRLSLTADGVTKRNELVFDFCIQHDLPLVISMGGGYPKNNNWEPILKAHAGVYVEAYQFLQQQWLREQNEK